MGIITALQVQATAVGTVDTNTSKMKLLVLSSVIAVALGAPEATAEADADAYYGQYQWPGAYGVSPYGHGFSSTCYGCRPYGHFGKRSADADADADADAYYGGLYGAYGGLYGGYGLGLGYARGYGYGPGVARHPVGHSYTHQSVQGLHGHFGKREAEPAADAVAEAAPAADAEPEADAYYGHYGYGGYGLGHHGYARGYVGRTVYGYPRYGYGHGLGYGYGHGYGHFGKRSAEPHGVALGVAGHPGHATSYVGPTVYGYPRGHLLGKRSADAEPTAEADADPYYGAYGYGGYGLAYGLPGHGYTRVSGLTHHGAYGYGYGLRPYLG